MFRNMLIALVVGIVAMTGCASHQTESLPLNQSAAYYNFIQPSFEDYVSESRDWLSSNRNFIDADQDLELSMNAPFMRKAAGDSDKAVLLAHGLGDSPFTFSDLANTLADQGFDVHVVLLPGHGSKPADLMLPNYQDWQTLVDHYANLLKQEYGQVWLGGFSTGANLVTVHALEQGGIDGLLLFSPGFQSQTPYLEKLTPVVASVFDWGWRTEETNLAKYSSSPFNAAVAYTASADRVRASLKRYHLEVPALVVMSEDDSVVDPEAVKSIFVEHFTHPQSQMIWYGETQQTQDKIQTKSMQLPQLRVSTASHMGVLFKPGNPYYGLNGAKLICENSFDSDKRSRCEAGEEVWYSAWGHTEEDKVHARLTWNPYYGHMAREIQTITQSTLLAGVSQ